VTRAVLLAVAVCSHTPSASAFSEDELVLKSGNDLRRAVVSETKVDGDVVSLELKGQDLQGEAFGEKVRIHFEGDEAKGSVGPCPFNLSLKTTGVVLHVDGFVEWKSAELVIETSRIHGSVATCKVDFARTKDPNIWTGSRQCQSEKVQEAYLQLSMHFQEWSPIGRASLLALLLGRATTVRDTAQQAP
jgi:hypothetical protein